MDNQNEHGHGHDHAQDHGHNHIIHYKVDDEPQETTERELTPFQIMKEAGIDPGTNYLQEIEGRKKKSFKEDPDKPIHMHEGMVFITTFMGPKPVSQR